MRLLTILILCASVYTQALEFYATPDGAGKADGTSWENAVSADMLANFMQSNLVGGDKLLLSGTFTSGISINVSGEDDLPIIIEGADTGAGLPLFQGVWSTEEPGSSNGSWAAVSFDAQSNLTIRNLEITGFMYGVNSGKSASSNISLENLYLHHVREGIYLNHVHESEVVDCRIVMYTKRGIRFDGDVNNVTITKVHTDHNQGDFTWLQEWPFGFMIEAKENNHSIKYMNCSSFNNTQERGSGDYWNGDGFVAENTAYNIKYYNCKSFNNADGGWDDKSKAPYLENCISFGNKRNFRFWNITGSASEPVLMRNCIGGYAKTMGGSGSQDGVWATGFVDIKNCTFHNNKSHAVSLEDGDQVFTVNVLNSILSVDTNFLGTYGSGNLTSTESKTTLNLQNCEKFVTDKIGTDPNFVADDPQWQGEPAYAFNSQTFGAEMGYWVEGSRVENIKTAHPAECELYANYPNPFNPVTTISFALSSQQPVELSVYDLGGRHVQTLVNTIYAAGKHSVNFSANHLPSGTYFYQLKTKNTILTRSMLILK